MAFRLIRITFYKHNAEKCYSYLEDKGQSLSDYLA